MHSTANGQRFRWVVSCRTKSNQNELAMRRVELPGADGGPKKAVVVSYVPPLTGEPGCVLSVRDKEFHRLMAEADRCLQHLRLLLRGGRP
jgi:hypothetical protein